MAKTVKVKSELKEEKRSALFFSVLFFLLFVLTLSFAFYMLFLIAFKDNNLPIGVPVGVGVLSLVFLILHFVKRKKYMVLRSGVVGENVVLKVLKTLPSEFTVVSNPIINNRGKYNELDFVVISKDAIFTVETKNYKGFLKGNASWRELTQVKFSKGGEVYSKTVKNPIFQADLQGKRMRDLLYDLKLPYSVYSILYFANETLELQIENDKLYNCKIIKGENELLNYIKETHGKKEINGEDIKVLINFLKR